MRGLRSPSDALERLYATVPHSEGSEEDHLTSCPSLGYWNPAFFTVTGNVTGVSGVYGL